MKRKNLGKKIMAAVVAAALACPSMQGMAVSAAELGGVQMELAEGQAEAVEAYAGDGRLEAIELPLNQESGEALQSREEAHVFCFRATDSPDTFYNFTFKNTGTEGVLEVQVNKSADFMDEDIIYTAGIDAKRSCEKNLVKLEAGHMYYIRINCASYSGFSQEAPYKLRVDTVEDDVKDTGMEAEKIALGREVEKGLQDREDVDVFCFTAAENPDTFYEFTFNNVGTEGIQEVAIIKGMDFQEEDIIYQAGIGAKDSLTENLVKLEAGHTYYIRVNHASYSDFAQESPYRFRIGAVEDDVKDTAADAKSIQVGKEASYALQNREDVDIFCFRTPNTDSFYEFKAANKEEGVIEYAVYDNQDLTGESIVSGGVDSKREVLEDLYKLQRNKTYYIKINFAPYSTYKKTVPYALLVSSRLDDANNAINNGDDQAKNFTLLQPGTAVKKGIQNKADVDHFQFKVAENGYFYTLKFANNSGGTLEYGVWDNQDYVGNPVEQGAAAAKEAPVINFGKLAAAGKGKAKTYYVRISHASYSGFAATENYSLNLTKAKDDVTDSISSAKALTLNTAKSFKLQNVEDEDYFKFTTTDFEDYTVDFTKAGKKGNVTITIYKNKKEGDPVLSYTCSGSSRTVSPQARQLKGLSRYKTYYIKVSGDIEAGYEIGINAVAPASKKIKMAAPKKVKLSWSKVARATGYQVYRAVQKNGKDGKFKLVKTVKKPSTVSYVDSKGLKKGTVYSYKVRAYRKVKGKKTCYTAFSKIQSKKI